MRADRDAGTVASTERRLRQVIWGVLLFWSLMAVWCNLENRTVTRVYKTAP